MYRHFAEVELNDKIINPLIIIFKYKITKVEYLTVYLKASNKMSYWDKPLENSMSLRLNKN